jgi:hypothetical protein
MGKRKLQLTDWYPYTIKPARVGVYQRGFNGNFMYSYWDGTVWCFQATSAKVAHELRVHKSAFQRLSWRGIKR